MLAAATGVLFAPNCGCWRERAASWQPRRRRRALAASEPRVRLGRGKNGPASSERAPPPSEGRPKPHSDLARQYVL